MSKTINILAGLTKLYSDKAVELDKNVQGILDKYRPLINAPKHHLSQQDIILITYANSLNKDGQFPLETLNDFLNENLKGIVNTVHILPFFPSSSDDGFSVSDYYQVNPSFGSWREIKALSANYRLMFDAVVNHISRRSVWFQEFLKANPDYEDYFIEVDENNPDLKHVFRPRALPLVHKYPSSGGGEKSVWTTFSEDQIDLNFSNGKVFLAVLELLLFYISKGARLIRLDAVGFLWKTLGTACVHLPETHLIIQIYRQIIEVLAPDALLITETNVPHKDNISYFGNGHNEAHLVYNFTLPPLLAFSIISQSVTKLAKWLSKLELPGEQACYFNFTASHDGVGLQPLKGILTEDEIRILETQVNNNKGYVSYKTNDDGSQSAYELNCTYLDLVTEAVDSKALKAKKFLLTQAVMLSLPGVPGVYIHSLLGTENDLELAESTGIPRRINRPHLDADKLMLELNEKGTLRNNIFSEYKKLLTARTADPFFDPFLAFEVHTFNEQLLAIHKRRGEDDFWALFNLSSSTQSVELAGSQALLNIIDNTTQDNASISLEPYGFYWLKSSKSNVE